MPFMPPAAVAGMPQSFSAPGPAAAKAASDEYGGKSGSEEGTDDGVDGQGEEPSGKGTPKGLSLLRKRSYEHMSEKGLHLSKAQMESAAGAVPSPGVVPPPNATSAADYYYHSAAITA